MGDTNNGAGRPELTEEEKNEILQKLEPYLKSGLPVNKALREAQVPSSTFYLLIDRDPVFLEKINKFRQYVSVLLNSAVIKQLQGIVKKQSEGKSLDKLELNFLKWFATNSNLTREEYGERKEIGVYDPEVEIQRLNNLVKELAEKKKLEAQNGSN